VLAGPAAAYALPLFRGREDRPARRLKDIGAAKPFAVAGAWAGASVLLPALESGLPLGAATPLLSLLVGYRMLFVLPNLLLADAAALAGDRAALLRSPRRLRRLAAGALTLALAGGGLAVALGGAPLLLAAELPAPALLLAGVATRPASRPLARTADLAMLAPALPAAWRAAEGLL
jgi:4-hydroxybenzoate polyprenyltransferase